MRLERKQVIDASKQDIEGRKRDIDTIKARSSASSFAAFLLSGYPSCTYLILIISQLLF
jgi:hypothetical protein